MRLIDADILKAHIKDSVKKQGGKDSDLVKISEIPILIDTQPTAYDVDEVVEQIKEMEICGRCLNNQNPIVVCATFCDVGKKLEIIKAGGVNEKEKGEMV